MSPKIVIHAGFHKTGTTTIQKTLRANRDVLRPACQIVLRPGMLALCEAARAYSTSRSATDLGLVQYEAASLAEPWAKRNNTILLSSEDLAGHMPGRRGLTRYDATPNLMKAMASAMAQAAPGAEIVLVFGTRAAEPWLKSCYVQHLRATRIAIGVEEYIADMRPSADLDAIVDAVADAVTDAVPGAVTTRFALDDCTTPLGPLAPVLALVPGVDAAAVVPRAPDNTAPPQGKIDALLALNRSSLKDDEWRAAKDALKREDF